MATTQQPARSASNPLFNANRVKLALFGLNCDYGCTMTTAEGRWELDWPATLRVAALADAAGRTRQTCAGLARGASGGALPVGRGTHASRLGGGTG
jgi:hypothetical protein